MVGQLLTSLAMLLCTPGFQWGSFFAGWDRSTLLVLVTIMGDEWLSALMVKRLSSVDKTVAKCSTLVILYSVAIVVGAQPLVLSQACGALMIVASTTLFPFI